MRLIKTVKIDDKEITVKELTVRQIWQLAKSGEDTKDADPLERMDMFLGLTCSGIDREEMMDLAPSEIRQLLTVFEEVNKDFLDIIKKMGLGDLVTAEIKKSMTSLTASSAA